VIDIFRIRFPKDKLAQFTPQERAFFFLFGYSLNQMAVFKKLVVFSSNKTPEAYVHQHVSRAQTQILVRHMVGIVSEAWELVNTRFLRGPVGKEYQDRLGPMGKEALEALKSHFGGSGLLSKMRNQIAFHHPYEADIEAGFKRRQKPQNSISTGIGIWRKKISTAFTLSPIWLWSTQS
jgi:hypothetical protein